MAAPERRREHVLWGACVDRLSAASRTCTKAAVSAVKQAGDSGVRRSHRAKKIALDLVGHMDEFSFDV